MPIDNISNPGILNEDLGYSYPMGLDLRPGQQIHDDLVSEIMRRARDSKAAMSKRYPTWQEVERTVTSYVPLDDEEQRIKENDSRRPVRIVVPLSYLMRDIQLTYLVAAFLDAPYHRYQGVTPEDVTGAMLLEQVIDVQNLRFRNALAYYVAFQDMLTYGCGVTTPAWEVQTAFKTRHEPEIVQDIFGGMMETGRMVRYKQEQVVAEGSRIDNVDMYNYFPDPNAPFHDPQRGEHVMWLQHDTYYNLLSSEQQGGLFNVRYLEGIDGRSCLAANDSGREDRFGGTTRSSNNSQDYAKSIDKLVCYITLIPRRWKIGERDYPEKWMFVIGGDRIILQAQPLNLNHQRYPVSVGCPNFDGYSLSPISSLEICYPMQEVADFVYSSRLAAVRKSLHDMFLVNPQMVYMPDVLNPKPGKVIRLRKSAWGQPLDNVLKQLEVRDVTAGNFTDLNTMAELMERVTGAVDILQGMAPSGSNDRVTAEQIQSQRSAALSRLQKNARLISLQFMDPLAIFHAEHTQQFMDQSTFVRITGPLQAMLQMDVGARLQVNPWDLNVGYDVVPHDGSMSGSQYNNAMVQLFQMAAANPELNANYDLTRIFGHMMRLNGLRNVDDFKRIGGVPPIGMGVNVMGDQQVQEQAQAGNIVPMNEYQQAGATA